MTRAEQVQRRLQAAREMARRAGEVTLRYFRSPELAVEHKGDASPVTAADRESEQLLRRLIAQQFPQDAIHGEEFGCQEGSSPFTWVLDPIDGTKSFIHGVPLYGTLIGLLYEEEPAAGVIHIPALEETVWGTPQQGSWYVHRDAPPQPCRLRPCRELDQATLLTSEVEGFVATGTFDVLQRLASATRITRTWGDCYGYLLLATGRADCMVDPRMHLWDAAAVMAVIQGAGGAFTDWHGRPRPDGGNGVATSAQLLPAVLELLKTPDR